MVMWSPVVRIPLIGQILEFGISPVKMVQRCYEAYGPVYTVPVSYNVSCCIVSCYVVLCYCIAIICVFGILLLSKSIPMLNAIVIHSFFKLQMGKVRMTFLIGPEAQEAFCKASDEVLSQDEVYEFMKPVFGPGVVYDATKKRRQVQFSSMANGLRTSRLKGYVEKIEKETREFIADWGEEGELDLFKALSELTILTASRCLHGNDVREQLFREVSELYHDLDHGLTPLTVFFPNAPTAAHKARNIARVKMVELFSKVIKSRRDDPAMSGSDGTDILSIFMEMKYKDGTDATDEQVTGLLIALLFAGQHTSCITSTWTSLFICHNKQMKNRIMAEQKEVFDGDTAGKLDFDKLNNMQLLHDSMKEALRLRPPLILLIRKAVKDLKVKAGGRTYTVPKGDMVLISPTVGMRVPEVFKNPDMFDPDRFGPGREEHKISPFGYLGFGGGMHSCMGQNFAFVQVKTILSILMREYDIEMVADELPDIDYTQMVVGPKGDCRIRYKRRIH